MFESLLCVCVVPEGEILLNAMKRNSAMYMSFEDIQLEGASAQPNVSTKGPSAATIASRSHRMTVIGQGTGAATVQMEEPQALLNPPKEGGFDAVITQAELSFSPGDNSTHPLTDSAASQKYAFALTNTDQYFSLQTMKVP